MLAIPYSDINQWLINEISDSPFLLNKFYDRHNSTVIKQRVPLAIAFLLVKILMLRLSELNYFARAQ